MSVPVIHKPSFQMAAILFVFSKNSKHKACRFRLSNLRDHAIKHLWGAPLVVSKRPDRAPCEFPHRIFLAHPQSDGQGFRPPDFSELTGRTSRSMSWAPRFEH